MGPRPWRPAAELESALERGDLRYALSLAEEVRVERGRPIDLRTATGFLELIAKQSPREFDAYALRWLVRWVGETPAATIEQAAELAGALADLPAEPSSMTRIRIAAQPGADGGA
jgi:hypothetical protein